MSMAQAKPERVAIGANNGQGQGLLLCTSLLDLDDLHANLASTSGVGVDSWIVTSVVGTPLPDYALRDESGRWPGFRPEVMWFPLMWLPPEVTARRRIDVQGGGQVEETDEMLAIRLCLAAMACGLYDPVDGTWLDVLSSAGLNRTSEEDLSLVRDWLEGVPVPELDLVDLRPLLAVTDEVQSTAVVITEVVEDAALAAGATELVGLIDELFDPEAARSDGVLQSSVVAMLELYRDLTPWWYAGDIDALLGRVRTTHPATRTADEVARWLAAAADEYGPSLEAIRRELAFG